MDVDEQLPSECQGLDDVRIRAAKNIAAKTGQSLSNACLHVREPTRTGLTLFKKRAREEGGRKTRRVRRTHKKRHQKKSRRNNK
jgi:hypothetical protein